MTINIENSIAKFAINFVVISINSVNFETKINNFVANSFEINNFVVNFLFFVYEIN